MTHLSHIYWKPSYSWLLYLACCWPRLNILVTKQKFFVFGFVDLDFFLEVLGGKCRFYNKKDFLNRKRLLRTAEGLLGCVVCLSFEVGFFSLFPATSSNLFLSDPEALLCF